MPMSILALQKEKKKAKETIQFILFMSLRSLLMLHLPNIFLNLSLIKLCWEKTLLLGKIVGGGRRGWWRMRWLDGITDSMDMSLSNSGREWRTGKPGVLPVMGLQRVKHDWATAQQQLGFSCCYLNSWGHLRELPQKDKTQHDGVWGSWGYFSSYLSGGCR